MTRKKSEDAVSPVIGIMLMLVVTIVLVAVIATFSTGLAAEAEPAPSAVLKVDVDSTWSYLYNNQGGIGSAFLTSVNGDPIDLEKVTVTLYREDGKSYTYTNPSKAGGVDQYLEAGETLNLAYGHFPETVFLIGSGSDQDGSYSLEPNEVSNGVLPVTAGTSIRAIVTYDETHVLYDKEVAVV